MVSTHHSDSYPPAPWRLAGDALLCVKRVSTATARPFVPGSLRIVEAGPDQTLSVLYLARYGTGASLQYHELIVTCAVVRRGLHVGAWVSHIYVDHPASIAGGREIWGLPKQLAQFEWSQDGCEIAVNVGSQPLCRLRSDTAQIRAPLPIYAPVMSHVSGRLATFHAAGRGWVGRVGCEVSMPLDGPLAPFHFEDTHRLMRVRDLNVNIGAPRLI
jgi:acetoacetate decarboxylase